MKKNRTFFIALLATYFVSCSSDNGSDYTPITTQTAPDTAEVDQNSNVLINILQNDTDVPANAILSVSSAMHGTVQIQNNGTTNTILDDTVLYTPTNDYVGTDTFQYTICAANNTDDCVMATVTITVLPVSPVVFDLANMPYDNLSNYNFFEGNIAQHNPVYGVIPYEPISSLFTDYAHKKRFIWMPENVSASYVSDTEVLNFPVGTILIKTFYYDNVLPDNTTRIIETRLMIKKETEWVFANYVWNTGQTEASLDLSGSFTFIEWTQDGETLSTNYRIPSETECHTCHKKSEIPIPIGPKPQNLNRLFNYETGSQNQLQKLVDMGYLTANAPNDIESVINWEDTSQSLDLRVRSYFDINCAHCHTNNSHCDYMSMRFAFEESTTEDNLGICVEPQESVDDALSHIVRPGNVARSALHFRMNTNQESIRMPLLGRTIVHQEALTLIEDWINSLTTECN